MATMFHEIPPDDVHLLDEKLGKGNFASVYKAQWNGEIVAVKKAVSRKEVCMVVGHGGHACAKGEGERRWNSTV